jgi:hypothetical protein
MDRTGADGARGSDGFENLLLRQTFRDSEIACICDETGVPMWSVGNTTYEKKGAKQVSIAGNDDKKQITATLTVAYLALTQLIWTGNEQSIRALPGKRDLPDGF